MPRTSRSSRDRNLPSLPDAISNVLPTIVTSGSASWVCAVRITSIPATRAAILRSQSKPLCDSSTTSCAPSLRALATLARTSSSRMPNVHFGIIQRGLAIGV